MREGPNLIDLDALGGDTPHMLVMVGGADPAGIVQELDDGVLARAREPHRGADRVAFAEKVEDARAVGCGQPIHTDHYA